MILKDGDKITLDGTEMDVTSAPPHGYWLKESSGSYYYMIYKTCNELDELLKVGRLKIGKLIRTEQGNSSCYHVWKKYVGIKEVYDYCTKCSEKQHKDWRLIKDEKDY